MLLSDREVLAAVNRGEIVIEPFRPGCLGPNSYDVHLGKTVGWYDEGILDCASQPRLIFHEVEATGFVLHPGKVYLAATEEYTETHKHVPYLDGKSSVGRLGIFIHATAGRGDVGFKNHWTLELVAVQLVRIYAGMPIGQLTYHEISSMPRVGYGERLGSKYQGRDPRPQPSMMYKNFGGGR